MVDADPELGTGLWRTKHHVWRPAAWISQFTVCSTGGFIACSWHATVVAVIYNTRTEGPRKNFQPSYYHRRSAFTDFSSHTLSSWWTTEDYSTDKRLFECNTRQLSKGQWIGITSVKTSFLFENSKVVQPSGSGRGLVWYWNIGISP